MDESLLINIAVTGGYLWKCSSQGQPQKRWFQLQLRNMFCFTSENTMKIDVNSNNNSQLVFRPLTLLWMDEKRKRQVESLQRLASTTQQSFSQSEIDQRRELEHQVMKKLKNVEIAAISAITEYNSQLNRSESHTGFTGYSDECCFSIVTSKMIDIIAENKDEASQWISTLRQLINLPQPQPSFKASSLLIKSAFMAISSGDIPSLWSCLRDGCRVDAEDPVSEETLVNFACRTDNPDILQVLVDWHAVLFDHQSSDLSPFQVAVSSGCARNVRMLLDECKRRNIVSSIVNFGGPLNQFPLLFACEKNDVACLALLLTHGADLFRIQDTGYSPLHVVCNKGYKQSLACLLDHGADVIIDYLDIKGDTALHVACRGGHFHCAKLLLQTAANLSISNNLNLTAYDLACKQGHQQMCLLLIEYGAITTNEKSIANRNNVVGSSVMNIVPVTPKKSFQLIRTPDELYHTANKDYIDLPSSDAELPRPFQSPERTSNRKQSLIMTSTIKEDEVKEEYSEPTESFEFNGETWYCYHTEEGYAYYYQAESEVSQWQDPRIVSSNSDNSILESKSSDIEEPHNVGRDLIEPVATEQQVPDRLGKFTKMLKVGVPLAAVLIKMSNEGLSVDDQNTVSGRSVNKPSDSSSSSSILALPIPPPLPSGLDESRRKLLSQIISKSVMSKSPSSSIRGKQSVQFMKIHWSPLTGEKLTKSMWSSIKSPGKSPEFGDNEIIRMESLFSARKTAKVISKNKSPVKHSVFSISRINNISIALTKFKALFSNEEEICEAISTVNLEKLTIPLLDCLKEVLPTEEEVYRMAKSVEADVNAIIQLRAPERLCLAINKYGGSNCLSQRINSIIFIVQFKDEARVLADKTRLIHDAAIQLRQCTLLVKIMRKILAVGNVMNQEKQSGFSLESLQKTFLTRGLDRKTSILDYVAILLVQRNSFPDLDLHSKISLIDVVSSISIKAIRQQTDSMNIQMTEVSNGELKDIPSITQFISEARDQLQHISESVVLATSSLSELADFFGHERADIDAIFRLVGEFVRQYSISIEKARREVRQPSSRNHHHQTATTAEGTIRPMA